MDVFPPCTTLHIHRNAEFLLQDNPLEGALKYNPMNSGSKKNPGVSSA